MAQRRTNAERRAATRGELFRLGVERFPIKGYTRTTIEDLLRGSGLSRGAFYFHFASKEHYFMALLDARAGERGEWWELAQSPEFDSLEAVVTAIYSAFNPPEAENSAWVMIIAEFARSVRAQAEDPASLAALEEGERIWLDELVRFVAALQERGFARHDRPAAELAETIQAVMDGVNLDRAVWGWRIDGVVDALVRILRP